MAENSGKGAAPWLALLVGGFVVLVLAIGYLAYERRKVEIPVEAVDLRIERPRIPEAPKLPDAPIPRPQ